MEVLFYYVYPILTQKLHCEAKIDFFSSLKFCTSFAHEKMKKEIPTKIGYFSKISELFSTYCPNLPKTDENSNRLFNVSYT